MAKQQQQADADVKASGVPVKVPTSYSHPEGVPVAVPTVSESPDSGPTKTGQKATTKEK